MESDRTLCQECLCYFSEDQKKEMQDEYLQSDFEFGEHLSWGDGFCDLNHNNAQHFFDLGDCCLENVNCGLWTHDSSSFINVILEYCPAHTCIKSNIFCIEEELGDGKCQDHNNSPYCDYDLGDCCTVGTDHQISESLVDCLLCKCASHSLYPNPYLSNLGLFQF